MGIGAEASRGIKARAVASEASYGGSDGLIGIDATKHQSHDSKHEGKAEDDKNDHDVTSDVRRDGIAIEAHRVDHIRMESIAEGAAGVAEKDDDTHDFETARSGTCHASTKR